jgi:S1-C subfamily serine protease
VLDIVLVVVLLVAVVQGSRRGLIRSITSLAGLALGGVAAAILAPMVGALVTDETWRVIATVATAIVLVIIGHSIGVGVGAAIGGPLRRTPLGAVDRALGAVAGLIVSGLVVALGVPFLAQPIASSIVLRTIDAATPQPVDAALAQLRSTVLRSGIPELGIALGGGAQSGEVPKTSTSAALSTAADSVVKITGHAYACGQEQAGSGFVVANDRVLTNAHVLAGVTDPVVLAPNGQAIAGRVVHFDPTSDLALIAVPGLNARALTVAATPQPGDTGVVDGYPYGGPFTSGGARVLQTGTSRIPDIGGGGSSARALATIAADVEPGNSGGPLLTPSGAVMGVVFAKSSTAKDVGYAMTPREFGPLVDQARSLTSRVSTGACVQD